MLTLGILSGTSVDAIDIALVDWTSLQSPQLCAYQQYPWPEALQAQLLALPEQPHISLLEFGRLDTACARAFAQAILTFTDSLSLSRQDICVIGSHGQTIWHQPTDAHPFSLQIGHPAMIAKHTGIATAGDFRMDDIALGGQGAPLAPILHRLLFAETDSTTAVLNLGGIANLSLFLPNGQRLGFDTGPANTLLDAWYRQHHPHCLVGFDANGRWANSASADIDLLARLQQHPFFQQPPPKSTGREDFSLAWLQAQLTQAGKGHLPPAVIQSTLLAFTVETIAHSLAPYTSGQLWLCGGGVHNQTLIHRLAQALPNWHIRPTDAAGYASDALEAMLFAYLGYLRYHQRPVDLSQITGQQRSGILGGLWMA